MIGFPETFLVEALRLIKAREVPMLAPVRPGYGGDGAYSGAHRWDRRAAGKASAVGCGGLPFAAKLSPPLTGPHRTSHVSGPTPPGGRSVNALCRLGAFR